VKLRPQDININEKVKKLQHQKTVEEIDEAIRQVERDYRGEKIDLEEYDEKIKEMELSRLKVIAEYQVYERKLREARDRRRARNKKVGGGIVDVDSAAPKPEQRKSKYLNNEPYQIETLQDALTRRKFNKEQ
jgi:hypothetical protein